METFALNFLIVFLTFIVMEGVAWFTHKYIMHGLLWTLHRDHHQKDHTSFFERNDYFFLIFAIPSIICLAIGSVYNLNLPFYIGIGIMVYGAAYFLVHEIFIHQRFKLFRNSNNWYFKGIRRAHKIHHKHLNKEEGECFGMLWVPFKYFIENKKRASS